MKCAGGRLRKGRGVEEGKDGGEERREERRDGGDGLGETHDEEENRFGEWGDVEELGRAIEDLEMTRRRRIDGGDFFILQVLHVCAEACEEREVAFELFNARAVLELLAEVENGFFDVQDGGEFDEDGLGWRRGRGGTARWVRSSVAAICRDSSTVCVVVWFVYVAFLGLVFTGMVLMGVVFAGMVLMGVVFAGMFMGVVFAGMFMGAAVGNVGLEGSAADNAEWTDEWSAELIDPSRFDAHSLDT